MHKKFCVSCKKPIISVHTKINIACRTVTYIYVYKILTQSNVQLETSMLNTLTL